MSASDQTLWQVVKRTARGGLIVVCALALAAVVLVISYHLGGLFCSWVGHGGTNADHHDNAGFVHTMNGLICLFFGAAVLRACYVLGES